MGSAPYGFLTCYDFYFYEAYPNIARQNVDVIIGCSHQRSDTLQAIELINRFLAYHTNAYVIRSSVCMEVGGNIGGSSQIVSPLLMIRMRPIGIWIWASIPY